MALYLFPGSGIVKSSQVNVINSNISNNKCCQVYRNIVYAKILSKKALPALENVVDMKNISLDTLQLVGGCSKQMGND